MDDLDGYPSDLQEAPGDQTTRETEKGFMHVGAFLVADTKSPKLVEPGEGSFDNPAPFPQSTAVLCISLCQEGPDATPAQTVADLLGIVSTIAYKAGHSRSPQAKLHGSPEIVEENTAYSECPLGDEVPVLLLRECRRWGDSLPAFSVE